MLKWLGNLINKFRGEAEHFHPEDLNDPIALKTEWKPAKGGGASFQTHKLVKKSGNRIEFQISIGFKVFCILFFVMGAICSIVFGFQPCKETIECVMPIMGGMLFMGAGGGMYYFGAAPRIFDKQVGYYWKGRQDPSKVARKKDLTHWTKLDRIHALQLISEHVKSDKSSYLSYEINLVLSDGGRINVVDHGKKSKVLEDADILAEFLDIPVWNAI